MARYWRMKDYDVLHPMANPNPNPNANPKPNAIPNPNPNPKPKPSPNQVLHPMGWDSFGLPAEQHEINTGTHPEETTKENIANFKRQLKSLGFSYDWGRELATTDVNYVR